MRCLFRPCCAGVIAVVVSAGWCEAEEPKTLLTMVAEWQYPGSKMKDGATMSDAATVNRAGERTVPSTFCTTVLTTKDPLDKIVEYYKAKLKQVDAADPVKREDKAKADDNAASKSGRSVMFHADSQGRPVGIQIIVVNTDKTSTTLVISRAEKESETHIAWTHYIRH